MNYYALVGNGDKDEKMCDEMRGASVIIGVDRGALWLLEHGIMPTIAVGDFDSVSENELKRIYGGCKDVRVYPVDKDKTDMELAIDVVQSLKEKGEIRMYGALGKRIDHTLGNIGLLERCTQLGRQATLIDTSTKICLVDQRIEVQNDGKYHYMSILPITQTAVVSLSGVRYPVKQKIIRRNSTLGVSNEIINNKAVVVVHKGKVLVIQTLK